MNATEHLIKKPPDHVGEAVQTTARLHAANACSATPVERVFEKMTALLARAAAAEFLTA